jgi:ribosomal protein L14E/L6E/L27E
MVQGQVVFSKCGRDKGRAFVVMSVEGDCVFLADGKLRPLARPKKKKSKHTQIVHVVLTLSEGVTDAEIRKGLLPFEDTRRV